MVNGDKVTLAMGLTTIGAIIVVGSITGNLAPMMASLFDPIDVAATGSGASGSSTAGAAPGQPNNPGGFKPYTEIGPGGSQTPKSNIGSPITGPNAAPNYSTNNGEVIV